MSEDEDVEELLRAAEEKARNDPDPEAREVRLANIARQRERLAEQSRHHSDLPGSGSDGRFESIDRLTSAEPAGPEPCPECGKPLEKADQTTNQLSSGAELYRTVYRCENGHESCIEAYGFDRGQAPFSEIVFEKSDEGQERDHG